MPVRTSSRMPRLQQLLHGVGLGLVADQGQGEGLEGYVDDRGPEDVGDLDDLVADVGGLGPHLEHDQLPADGPLGQQLLHGVDGELLAQLVHDLLDHGLVGPHLDGDAGHGWVVGGATARDSML